MDWWAFLAGAGCFLGALASWFSVLSPRARRRKIEKKEHIERERQVHEALYGMPEIRDDSNSVIKEAQPGLLAEMHMLRKEFPVNGVPTRQAIEELRDDVREMKEAMADHLSWHQEGETK